MITQMKGFTKRSELSPFTKDLRGLRFDCLTVENYTEKRSGHSVVWQCICDCGNTAYKSAESLRRSKTNDCGCRTSRKQSTELPPRAKDLRGLRFDRLIVEGATEMRRYNSMVWRCICDCSNVVNKATVTLKEKMWNDCGCGISRKHSKNPSGRVKDLRGQRFGKVTVIKFDGVGKNQLSHWLCRCDCGRMTSFSSANLKNVRNISCGCANKRFPGSKCHDITGSRSGLLVAIKHECVDQKRQSLWLCRCDCGRQKVFAAYKIKSRTVKSCGCAKKKGKIKHGLSRQESPDVRRAFNAWINAKSRCENPNNRGYLNYGGRGIRMHPVWHDPVKFIEDMGPCPTGYSLDRINFNKGYEPGNCRWATRQTQAENKRKRVKAADIVTILAAFAGQSTHAALVDLIEKLDGLTKGKSPGSEAEASISSETRRVAPDLRRIAADPPAQSPS